MKSKSVVWGVAAALSICATGVSAHGAETDTNPLSATSPERTLGTVERGDKIIGREIRNNSNQRIGKLSDMAVDLESGRAIFAVVSVGGFLGVGDRSVAVPANALTEEGKQLRLDVDKQKLMEAPQFSKSTELTPAYASTVYRFFGQSDSWFESSAGQTGKQFENVHKVSGLIGMNIKDASDRQLGTVENVMLDLKAGRVAYVILKPDSSLDLKDNLLYALPPNTLTTSSDKKSLTAGIDEGKLASGPHFTKNDWPDMSGRSWATKVYQHYGKETYFEDGALQPTSTTTNSQQRIYHEPRQSNP